MIKKIVVLDAHIRIYNTKNGNFKLMKRIRAKDVGWSVVDTAFRFYSVQIHFQSSVISKNFPTKDNHMCMQNVI